LLNCALLNHAGAFGENLSVLGIDENDVCIGDQLRIGSALFEVSQGRQPCFKLKLRFGYDDMATQVQSTLRVGWYFRVIEEGYLQIADTIELGSRPHGKFAVAYLLALIRDGVVNPDELQPILALPLTESWRQLSMRRISNSRSEDWRKRLFDNT
jgi:MOSC domain-containing protein YiiM